MPLVEERKPEPTRTAGRSATIVAVGHKKNGTLAKKPNAGMKGRGADRTAASRREQNSGGLPDYESPPVSEVACGISFQPLKQFLLPHVGLYWGLIRDVFPTAEHAPPLVTSGSEPTWNDAVSGLPLPRTWFITERKDGLIQLQGDCFYYNWRRLGDSDVYPRYQAVMTEYRRHLATFRAFLEQNKFPQLSVTSCELTYVNHIPQEQGWDSFSDLAKVFKDYCWAHTDERFLPPPKNATWKIQFGMPSETGGGNLTVNAVPAMRVTDQMPTIKLEISAKVRMESKPVEDTWPWFDVAHEWIVKGFADLTEEQFQKTAWKKING